jgi:hypothetical protein
MNGQSRQWMQNSAPSRPHCPPFRRQHTDTLLNQLASYHHHHPSPPLLLKALHGLVLFWLLLYAHRHRSLVGAAGRIILTPANQLMEMGLKTWSLSNPGFEQGTFRSLAQHAYHLR